MKPPYPLREFVHSLWFVRGRGPALRTLVPATACTEVGFNLDAPIFSKSAAAREFEALSPWWVEGLQQSFCESQTSGPTTIMGFRLYPGGAYRLLGRDVADYADQLVPATSLRKASLDRLHEALLQAPDVHTGFRLLESYLMQIPGSQFRGSRRIAQTALKLAMPTTTTRISTFCRDEGLAHQRFIREFREQFGITPKRYTRIARFRSVCEAMKSARRPDWADLASRFGYCDQSHLIREFRQKSGCSPQQFLDRVDNLSHSVAVMDSPR